LVDDLGLRLVPLIVVVTLEVVKFLSLVHDIVDVVVFVVTTASLLCFELGRTLLDLFILR
jgi:hypothetical protein